MRVFVAIFGNVVRCGVVWCVFLCLLHPRIYTENLTVIGTLVSHLTFSHPFKIWHIREGRSVDRLCDMWWHLTKWRMHNEKTEAKKKKKNLYKNHSSIQEKTKKNISVIDLCMSICSQSNSLGHDTEKSDSSECQKFRINIFENRNYGAESQF